nr:ABC transporter ATP-binding protein [Paenisporosarcina cavernae]
MEASSLQHIFFSEEGYTVALEDVSFSIEEGDFISFIGPSGCGKSTLLSIIANLIKPTSGRLTQQISPSEIGYMLQQDYLFPWKTIKENILLGLRLQNREDTEIVDDLLRRFQLTHTANFYPAQLSGGMRQRISLARTLAVQPRLLLLDEPFSALDFYTKLLLENFVAKTIQQLEKTAILVTHDIAEAIAMSDRVYLFSNRPGTILKVFDIPEEIRNLAPFEARNSPLFQPLFQTIWKELEANGYENVT